jgi:hypothetical protein
MPGVGEGDKMNSLKGFLIFAGGLLVAGCAAQGQAPSRGGPEHLPSAQAQPASQGTATAAANKDDSYTRGYQKEVVRGQEMYCQREAVTGMRISQKVCMTEDQLKEEQERAKQLTHDLGRAQSNGRPQECRTMGSTAPC